MSGGPVILADTGYSFLCSSNYLWLNLQIMQIKVWYDGCFNCSFKKLGLFESDWGGHYKEVPTPPRDCLLYFLDIHQSTSSRDNAFCEETLFFNHVLDCLPLAVARVTRIAQAWKWPCAWLPCPCTHDTWCGCQTWSRISAICRSSWSWVASSPWSTPWTQTSWAASSRTWQLTGFSGKDSHPRMSELAQT